MPAMPPGTTDHRALRQLPFWAGVAFTVGLGTALVTGQGVAHAEPNADSTGGAKPSASASSAGPARATTKPRSALALQRNTVGKVPSASATVQTVSARTIKTPAAAASSARITIPGLPPQVRALIDEFVAGLRLFGQTLAANDGPDSQGHSPRTGTGETPPSTPSAVIASIGIKMAGPLVLSPDGKTAYTTDSWNGTLVVIDTATNTITKTVKIPRDSPIGGVLNYAPLAITPDGTRLYIVKNGGRVAVVDTATDTVVAELKADAGAIQVSPDGHYLWVSRPMSEDGVGIWDLSTNRLIKTFSTGFSFMRPHLVVTPDGFRAYVNSAHNVQVVKLDVIPYPATTILVGEKRSLTLSPDGTRLYVGDADSEQEMNPPFRDKVWGMIRVVDTATNKVVAQINVTHLPKDVVFSPNGSRAYVGFENSGKIAVIDTSTNTVIGSLDGVDVRSMTVSPDGTRLYVTTASGISVVSTATVGPIR